MAIDIKFFGASLASGSGDGHTLPATINGVVAAGDLIIVNAVGGPTTGGLSLPTMTDNGTGTGWHKIGDSVAATGEFRTTKFWKLMTGGETTITCDWTTSGTTRALEAIVCRGMGTLLEPYVIREKLAASHFGNMEMGVNDGQGTTVPISGNGQVYVGCTSIGAHTYTGAGIANPPSTHDNNSVGGDGQNNGSTFGIGCIIHINDSAAGHTTADNLLYQSSPLNTTFDSWIGIRPSTAASTNLACTTTCNTSVTYTRTVGHVLTAAVSSTVTNTFTRLVNRPLLASVIAHVSAVTATRRRRPLPMYFFDDDSD